jgi:hypothetical protein
MRQRPLAVSHSEPPKFVEPDSKATRTSVCRVPRSESSMFHTSDLTHTAVRCRPRKLNKSAGETDFGSMEAQTPTSVRRRCDIVAATRQLQVLCPHGQLLSDCTKCSASAAEASAAEASAAEASPASPSLNVKIPACNDPPLLPELEKGLERSCKICKGPRGQCHRRGTFRHLPRIGSQDWLRSLQYSAKDSSSGQTTRGTCRKCKGRRGECRSPGTPGHLRRGAGTARPLSSSKTPTKRKQPAPPRKCEHGKWFGECSKCRVLLSRSQQRKLRRRCAHGRESSTFPVPSLYLPCTFPVPSLYHPGARTGESPPSAASARRARKRRIPTASRSASTIARRTRAPSAWRSGLRRRRVGRRAHDSVLAESALPGLGV